MSACHGLVRTLGARGYLYEVGPRRGYYPTQRWLDKARLIASRDPLLERAAPLRIGGEPYGLAVAGPEHRMTPNLARHAKRLLRAVRRITEEEIT